LHQLRQQDLEFAVTDKGVASDNRHVERLMLVDHLEHARDQFLSFEIGQAAQVCAPKMSVFVGVAPGAPQRAFFRDFNGKRWDATAQDSAPGLQN
jgi:hypothetical protein